MPKCSAPGVILPNMLPLVFMKKKPYILHKEERQRRVENVNPQELETKTMHCSCAMPTAVVGTLQTHVQDMPGRKATGLMHGLRREQISEILVWHPDEI